MPTHDTVTVMDNRSATPEGSRAWIWAFCGFALIGSFFLWSEHRAHLLGFLPYALLLACPLMHVFMHRGDHARHGNGRDEARYQRRDDHAHHEGNG